MAEAGLYQITDITDDEAKLNAAFLGVDLISVFIPIKGVGKVAKEGFKAVAKGSLKGLAGEIVKAFDDEVLKMAVKAGKDVTKEQCESFAKRLLTKLCGVAVAGTPFAVMGVALYSGYSKIADMPEGPEKEAALNRFWEDFTSSVAMLAFNMVAMHRLNKEIRGEGTIANVLSKLPADDAPKLPKWTGSDSRKETAALIDKLAKEGVDPHQALKNKDAKVKITEKQFFDIRKMQAELDQLGADLVKRMDETIYGRMEPATLEQIKFWNEKSNFSDAIKGGVSNIWGEAAEAGNETAAALVKDMEAGQFKVVYDPELPARGQYLPPKNGGKPTLVVNPFQTIDGKSRLRSLDDIASTLIHEYVHFLGHGEVRAVQEQLKFLNTKVKSKAFPDEVVKLGHDKSTSKTLGIDGDVTSDALAKQLSETYGPLYGELLPKMLHGAVSPDAKIKPAVDAGRQELGVSALEVNVETLKKHGLTVSQDKSTVLGWIDLHENVQLKGKLEHVDGDGFKTSTSKKHDFASAEEMDSFVKEMKQRGVTVLPLKTPANKQHSGSFMPVVERQNGADFIFLPNPAPKHVIRAEVFHWAHWQNFLAKWKKKLPDGKKLNLNDALAEYAKHMDMIEVLEKKWVEDVTKPLPVDFDHQVLKAKYTDADTVEIQSGKSGYLDAMNSQLKAKEIIRIIDIVEASATEFGDIKDRKSWEQAIAKHAALLEETRENWDGVWDDSTVDSVLNWKMP